jgi:hypothetical protein
VPAAAAGPLRGGQIQSYGSQLMVNQRVDCTTAGAPTQTATVTHTGPEGTGSYDLTVGETVRDGKLLVTRVQAVPAD